ncbi:putative nuclease HARBI1 [Sardina pilchardus]|uniref:putative nuclease HARBI1 n=1 Tax=Sardina pilchardus TaxID=27697 RepID=UPI002E140C47
MEVFNDRAIIERYRLPREAIRQLLEATGEDLRRSTRRSFALTAETQLLAALRFFATGSFLQVVGDGHGLCKASVSRSVQAVTDCLLRLVPEHLTFPTREEMTGIQGHFFRTHHIPQVTGVVDGTLVPILTPHDDGHIYICRKGYAAINCQVVCDHRGIILDVVARWPGSTHDSFIFRESTIGREATASRGEWRLLGDSGYPLRPFLFTPVANPEDDHKRAFNEAHRLARSVVERTIGRWKMRFRCLHRSSGGLLFSPAKACAVICVTAMLHNIAVWAGLQLDEPEED